MGGGVGHTAAPHRPDQKKLTLPSQTEGLGGHQPGDRRPWPLGATRGEGVCDYRVKREEQAVKILLFLIKNSFRA